MIGVLARGGAIVTARNGSSTFPLTSGVNRGVSTGAAVPPPAGSRLKLRFPGECADVAATPTGGPDQDERRYPPAAQISP